MSTLKKTCVILSLFLLVLGLTITGVYGVVISSSAIIGEDSAVSTLPCIGVVAILIGIILLTWSIKDANKR